VDGRDSGLRFEAFRVPGKRPAYLFDVVPADPEETVGYRIADPQSGRSVAYVPGISELDAELVQRLAECDCLLFDGTFWRDDELPGLGISPRSARAMGHIPISGPEGSLAKLAGLRRVRKIFTHVNNTNPILVEDSRERREIQAAGWEVAFDGMELTV
jgi:pyrroloquinoline quinone biosynthesis protein B